MVTECLEVNAQNGGGEGGLAAVKADAKVRIWKGVQNNTHRTTPHATTQTRDVVGDATQRWVVARASLTAGF